VSGAYGHAGSLAAAGRHADAERVLVPAGRLPWRCLRLVPALLRRGIIAGLAALGVVPASLIGYAATGRGLLLVPAPVAVPVLWVCGFAETLGPDSDRPGRR
jgi:hypothetical protein